jgi:hypothetical protein
VRRYTSAKSAVESDYDLDEDDKSKAKQLKIDLLNNLATCQSKLQKHAEVISACDEVLKLDERNLKALVRRGGAAVSTRQVCMRGARGVTTQSRSPIARDTVRSTQFVTHVATAAPRRSAGDGGGGREASHGD